MRRPAAVFAALIVAAVLPGLPLRPACADDGWADLTRRIAAAQPRIPDKVILGAEPPGFEFPLSARPALPVLGSTWFILVPGPPEGVHVFYVPLPQTTAAVDALVAKLKAARYAPISGSGFPNGFVGDDGPARTWCPADLTQPAITLNVETVAGVPALDLSFASDARHTSCGWGGGMGPGADSPIPALGGIAGMEIFVGMRSTESREGSLGSVGIIRTGLPPAEALAKLAERFSEKGWIARAGPRRNHHPAALLASRRSATLERVAPPPAPGGQQHRLRRDARRDEARAVIGNVLARVLCALVAAGAFFPAATGIARADDDQWAALAQRIAGSNPYAHERAALGAEPPGFAFPLAVRPALPVLGSTWYGSSKNNALPLIAHIFYVPTSHTGTVSESLFAQLTAAGYTRLPDSEDLWGMAGREPGRRAAHVPARSAASRGRRADRPGRRTPGDGP